MFNIKMLQCTIATYTMHAKFNSIHGDYYCQVFGNKDFLFKSYPMEKKSDCHEAIEIFVKDYGTPDSMINYGAQEQVGPGTKLQANLRKYDIHGHTSKRGCSNQNRAEGVI